MVATTVGRMVDHTHPGRTGGATNCCCCWVDCWAC